MGEMNQISTSYWMLIKNPNKYIYFKSWKF